MAVAHAFHHDSRAIRPMLQNAPTTASAVFLGVHDDPGGGGGCGHLLPGGAVQRHHQSAAVAGNTVVSSDLTCNNNNNNNNQINYDATWSVPRKRARIGDAGLITVEGHRVPLSVPQPSDAHQGVRVLQLCSSAAESTSGRRDAAAGTTSPQNGILSHLYRHGVETDALVRFQNERLRLGLEEARRRHARAVVSAVERAAALRLRAAEAELERALARNAELGDKVREMGAEGQAWRGVASGHEAAAAGLRATLEQQLLLHRQAPPDAEGQQGEVEDARSCCCGGGGGLEPEEEADRRARGGGARRKCRCCGEKEACVLLLPCRHLCLCGGCEAGVEACPVCAATRNASLHVLLS